MYINVEFALFMVAIVAIVLLLIALIIYNHHANARNEALLRIDRDLQEKTLAEVKEIVANGMKAKEAETVVTEPVKEQSAEQVMQETAMPEKEIKTQEAVVEESPIASEKEPTDVLAAVFADLGKTPMEEETEEEFGYIPYRKGQSGHIYSKEELAVQIRD